MSTGVCKSPDSRYWRALYKAALSEIGNSKLPERIAEAEKAVVLRARELFQAADDNGEEKEALEDAMYALHALGLTQQQLRSDNRIAIIIQGWAGRHFRGSDYLQVV